MLRWDGRLSATCGGMVGLCGSMGNEPLSV